MPQIIPAIAAAGSAFAASSVGTFLTTTVLGKFLASTAISLAVNALAVALAPNQQTRSGGISTNVTTSGAEHARSFILGTYATAGHGIMPPLCYDIDKDDRKYLTYVLGLSDTRISGVESVMVDGQMQQLQAQRLPGHPAYHFDDELGARPVGELEPCAWFKFKDGSQTAVDPMLLSKFEFYPDRPITSDFKFTGVAYAIASFKYNTKDPKFLGFLKSNS